MVGESQIKGRGGDGWKSIRVGYFDSWLFRKVAQDKRRRNLKETRESSLVRDLFYQREIDGERMGGLCDGIIRQTFEVRSREYERVLDINTTSSTMDTLKFKVYEISTKNDRRCDPGRIKSKAQ